MKTTENGEQVFYCDFCNRSMHQVEVIIAAENNKAHICNKCVCESLEIILKKARNKTVSDEVIKDFPKGGY